MIEIPFSINPPKGIPFYSAHFKIDVYKYFSELRDDEYSILLDNDILCMNEFSEEFFNIVQKGIPMVYHFPYNLGKGRLEDVRRIDPSTEAYQWCGGEFIGGSNVFYKMLYNDIQIFIDKYFAEIPKGLFHIGDEMLTTIGLEHLRKNGLYYFNAYMLGVIYRYWGNEEQYPLNHYKYSLIHLPYDKVFLSRMQLNDLTSRTIIKKYKKIRFINKIKKFVKKITNL